MKELVSFRKNKKKYAQKSKADGKSNVVSFILQTLADPHVKVALIHAGKRLRKKKTSTRKCDLNPVFNEAVSFDISLEMMNNVDLLLSVMHENDPVGCVLIGVHATGKELEHWKAMRTVDRPVANWHKLQEPKKFY